MSSPRTVSVVIPTHDRPDDCMVAIESALAQTVAPLEVIIVDDGSSSATGQVIQDICAVNEALTYLRLESAPRGPAAARNAGVRASSGDLVAFLDDDDEWLPEKLERQLPWFEHGYGVVCSNAFRSSGGEYFPDEGRHEIERRELLVHNPVVFSTAVIKRSLLPLPTPLDEASWLLGIEDYELFLRLSDAGTMMVRLGEPLALYRDFGDHRLSSRDAAIAASVARMSARRSSRRPLDLGQHRATLRNTLAAGRLRQLR